MQLSNKYLISKEFVNKDLIERILQWKKQQQRFQRKKFYDRHSEGKKIYTREPLKKKNYTKDPLKKKNSTRHLLRKKKFCKQKFDHSPPPDHYWSVPNVPWPTSRERKFMKNLQGYQCGIFNHKAKYYRVPRDKWDAPPPNNNSIVVNPIMPIYSLNTILNTKTSEMVPFDCTLWGQRSVKRERVSTMDQVSALYSRL